MDSVLAIFHLPKDSAMRDKLQQLLTNFKGSRDEKGGRWDDMTPARAYLCYTGYRTLVYKIGILEALLDPGNTHFVYTTLLAKKLRRENGGSLNIDDFISACREVAGYLEQAQSPARGKNHLRLVETHPR